MTERDFAKELRDINEKYRAKRDKRENDFALFTVFMMAAPFMALAIIAIGVWLQKIT